MTRVGADEVLAAPSRGSAVAELPRRADDHAPRSVLGARDDRAMVPARLSSAALLAATDWSSASGTRQRSSRICCNGCENRFCAHGLTRPLGSFGPGEEGRRVSGNRLGEY